VLLDDPKEPDRDFEELERRPRRDDGREGFAQGHAVFTKLLAENPRMLDVWDMDSRALMSLGKPEESLACAEEDRGARPRDRP